MSKTIAKIDINNLTAQLDQDGFVLIKEAIPKQRVKEVRQFLLPIFQERKEKGLNPNKGLKDVLFDTYVNYPEIIDTLCNLSTIQALQTLLGQDFVLIPDSSVAREYYGTLHTDMTGNELHGWMFHKEPDFRIVTVGLYLQDNNQYGGGLFVVPGSHKQADPYVEIQKKRLSVQKSKIKRLIHKLSRKRIFNYERPLREHAGGIDLPIEAGDVVIFDMRIIHRASYAQVKDPAPDGGKIAIYSRCSKNNKHAKLYTEYLKSLKTPGYEYIHQSRDLSALKAMETQYGFQAW